MAAFLIFSLSNACTNTNSEVPPKTELSSPSAPDTSVSNIENPFAPQESDSSLTRAPAYVNSATWDPSTYSLHLAGDLPTACHQLRIAPTFNASETVSNLLMVEVYTVISSDMACTAALEPFETTLIVENIAEEIYAINVNDQEIFP